MIQDSELWRGIAKMRKGRRGLEGMKNLKRPHYFLISWTKHSDADTTNKSLLGVSFPSNSTHAICAFKMTHFTIMHGCLATFALLVHFLRWKHGYVCLEDAAFSWLPFPKGHTRDKSNLLASGKNCSCYMKVYLFILLWRAAMKTWLHFNGKTVVGKEKRLNARVCLFIYAIYILLSYCSF